MEIGVTTIDDISMVTEDDLKELDWRLIQRRKLLKAFAKWQDTTRPGRCSLLCKHCSAPPAPEVSYAPVQNTFACRRPHLAWSGVCSAIGGRNKAGPGFVGRRARRCTGKLGLSSLQGGSGR